MKLTSNQRAVLEECRAKGWVEYTPGRHRTVHSLIRHGLLSHCRQVDGRLVTTPPKSRERKKAAKPPTYPDPPNLANLPPVVDLWARTYGEDRAPRPNVGKLRSWARRTCAGFFGRLRACSRFYALVALSIPVAILTDGRVDLLETAIG